MGCGASTSKVADESAGAGGPMLRRSGSFNSRERNEKDVPDGVKLPPARRAHDKHVGDLDVFLGLVKKRPKEFEMDIEARRDCDFLEFGHTYSMDSQFSQFSQFSRASASSRKRQSSHMSRESRLREFLGSQHNF
ncbi:unnamed protein product [Symbiodinium necroappetens]|uniref:Uncharacterized protein n=1 Tax=Symbiodinium necroappetens TaxID=1628268 RepID=A0A812IWV1_9DINO|nr:unnamed protein product [Symbiodinium necroappetens]